MGGSGEWDFSGMSIIARPAVSDDCEFKLWCRWITLPCPPFQFSWRWGLTPRRLCPEDTGLENKESEAWKSWRSTVVLWSKTWLPQPFSSSPSNTSVLLRYSFTCRAPMSSSWKRNGASIYFYFYHKSRAPFVLLNAKILKFWVCSCLLMRSTQAKIYNYVKI